jgi:hypothetical protein
VGFSEFMERKAQQEILKRALDAELTAGTCNGMLYGPVWMALEYNHATRDQVDTFIDHWLDDWQFVRHLSDRNLHRNRPHYLVRPNVRLSPLLEEFESQLKANRLDAQSDTATIFGRVKEAVIQLSTNLYEFHRWAMDDAGPMIGLNLASYEDKAARRAQKTWQPAVRALLEGEDQ